MTDEPPDHVDDELDEVGNPELGEALRALLDPAGDLRSVAVAKVDRRLQGRSVVSTISDLSSVGWVTIRHLLTNPPSAAEREGDCEVPMSECDP